jgi:hypothetical protein
VFLDSVVLLVNETEGGSGSGGGKPLFDFVGLDFIGLFGCD